MMGDALPFSVEAFVEDVLKRSGSQFSEINLASKKAQDASLRRYEAARWLRKTIGVVGGRDLPAEPSEEEFRLGLRSGTILCNVLNKIQPGAVPRVVEGSCDSLVPEGAPLSAYRYFENVRNFLVAVEELGLPSFESSDLEKGGTSARVVHCILALKSYGDWKQGGGNGPFKFGGVPKLTTPGKHLGWKNLEPFMGSSSRVSALDEKSMDSPSGEQLPCTVVGYDLNEMNASGSLYMLVQTLLLDKKHEDIPMIMESMPTKVMEEFEYRLIVESMLSKVMEEFEHRLVSQAERLETAPQDEAKILPNKSLLDSTADEMKVDDATSSSLASEESCSLSQIQKEGSETEPQQLKSQDPNPQELEPKEVKSPEPQTQLSKQNKLFEQQHKDIVGLKHTLHTTKADIQVMQMRCKEEFNTLGKQLHGVALAASKYQKVFEDNRKLYNQLQDLKGSIRVYCRVRPFLSGGATRLSSVGHLDDGSISIITPSKTGKDGRKSFNFNKVFGPSATQADVFTDTQPLIRSVLDGYNVCIFAYGQTGSGKTFTMTGPKELTEESLGVNYRALGDLFQLSEQRRDTIFYEISVQMIEIYNEQVRDLLTTDGGNKRLEIRNSSQNGINVPDANIVPVSTTSDVISLMTLGHKNRTVSATACNDRSSRSHSCLTVHVHGRDMTSGAIIRGCMHVVDLAGSERVDKSEVTGDRLKEAQHINKSLSALGDVIAALAHKNSHVPYRNSKLTQLLQDSLGGQAKTLMFVHVSPEPDALGETISTLKFAERVSTVELGAARVNKDSAEVKDLKEQIASLKAALAKEEGLGRLPGSKSGSPDKIRTQSAEDSPSNPHWQGREDVANLEVPNLVDVRERGVGDWIDKVMLKKQDDVESTGHCEEDSRQLPETFYQKHIHDQSQIKILKNDSQDCGRTRSEIISDNSGDFDAATSESSETDLLYQSSLSKKTNIPNGLGSKTKRPILKSLKSSETRTLGAYPLPARKTPNGLSTALHRVGRPVDMKRRFESKTDAI